MKTFPNLSLLLLRLYVGLSIGIGAGFPKVQEFPATDWFVEQVGDRLGFPFPNVFAFLAAWGEFLGGLLIAAGLFTRVMAAQLAIQFAVAAFLFHGSIPFFDIQIAQLYLFAFLLLFFQGAGTYAVDPYVWRWWKQRNADQA